MIYELINFEGPHESIAQFDFVKEQVILINGVSKGFAMTGWRVGYLAAPEWIARACDKLQGQMTSATSSISQLATLEAMQTDPNTSPEIQIMVSTFRDRRDHALDILKTIPGLITNVPQGAFYIFPNVSSYFGKKINDRTIRNAVDLSMYLLDDAHVAVVPGEAFGSPNCIRISYATALQKLTEALIRLKNALAQLQ